MINLFWRLFAKLLARPAIANWLIARAQRTPYQHIMSADGSDMYMGRWWLFNPYSRETHKAKFWWFPWSIRIHHIMRPDADRDLHSHPWNARTIIMRGGYTEERPAIRQGTKSILSVTRRVRIIRRPGDTATLTFGEYHRIDYVQPEGAFTLFITSKWRGDWGFMVSGRNVPWRTYTGETKP